MGSDNDDAEKMSFWSRFLIILLQPINGHAQTTTVHQILTYNASNGSLISTKICLTMDIMLYWLRTD